MIQPPEKIITCDILIVGGGAAGLTGAASTAGLSTILVEKQERLGGKTASSSGMIWMPEDSIAKSWYIWKPHRATDRKEQGRTYIQNAISLSDQHSNGAPSATVDRRINAFLTKGPEMIDFLRGRGFKWMKAHSRFPDYQPKLDGALPAGGRTLDPAVFDIASLGSLGEYLSDEDKAPLVLRFEDFRVLTSPFASIRNFFRAGRMSLRSSLYSLYLKRPASMGQSLIAQLLSVCGDNGSIEIYTETELIELWHRDGIVLGGSFKQGNETFKVRALRGVLLATGDFGECQDLKDVKFPSGGDDDYDSSDGPQYGNGHVTALCRSVRARMCVSHEIGGIPTMKEPRTGRTVHAMFEIARPFSIIVDHQGHRFFAESRPPSDATRSMYARAGGHEIRDARSWLVLDQNYRRRYMLGDTHRWNNITKALNEGILLEAGTIGDLADKMGIVRQALDSTIRRWNEMCRYGTDIHHKRGDDDYQRFIGDPGVSPNSCLGAIERAPFYAIRISPGDVGRKKRLWTDEHGRVLRCDGGPIPGLYAAGSITACALRSAPLGAGGTLASTMVFAYTAVQHMFSQLQGSPMSLNQGLVDEKVMDTSDRSGASVDWARVST